jgi:hypothetical protein
MGRPPARPARTPSRYARACGLVPAGKGFYPFAPAPRSPEAWPARRRRVPPRPLRGVKPGVVQGFRIASRAAVLQKRGRRPKPQLPKPPTHWGFRFPFLCVSAGRGEEKGRRLYATPEGRQADREPGTGAGGKSPPWTSTSPT